MLSKMHKIDNSGRPTVSSIGFLGNDISKFVNYRLQPILKIYLLTYKIQVTFWIRSRWQIRFMNIKSLYTSVPNSDGNSGVKGNYESYPENSQR